MYRLSYILKCLGTIAAFTFMLYYYSTVYQYTKVGANASKQWKTHGKWKKQQQELETEKRPIHKQKENSFSEKTNNKNWTNWKLKEKPWRNRTRGAGDGEEESQSGLKVVFVSLKGCEKPEYLPGYKALCYKNKQAAVQCLPNYHLIGIRKCGTTDVIKWFQYHSDDLTVAVKGDKIPARIKCPMDYFRARAKLMDRQTDYMNYGPGEIMFSGVKSKNDTHIEIVTTMHYLAYLGDPERTKYIVTLRNPTDRLISYLFHAHNQRWIHTKVSKGAFNAEFVHNIVVTIVNKAKKCLEKNGELACTYMFGSNDGNLDSVVQHGFYVVYLTEMFKIIPRDMIYINQLEEYSSDQLKSATKFMEFFDRKLKLTDEEVVLSSQKQRNTGTKSPVLPETVKMLNDLYRPFNKRLSVLLGDERWLYDIGT